MQSKIGLKPCPFCGGGAYVYPTEFGWSAQCEDCWSTGADEETAQKAIDAWNHRAEPENRVLTLEEVKRHCAAPLWMEFRRAKNSSHWAVVIVDDNALWPRTYGKSWRCWLRKPTEEEAAGTPWEEKKEERKHDHQQETP